MSHNSTHDSRHVPPKFTRTRTQTLLDFVFIYLRVESVLGFFTRSEGKILFNWVQRRNLHIRHLSLDPVDANIVARTCSSGPHK